MKESLKKYMAEIPEVADTVNGSEVFWLNPEKKNMEEIGEPMIPVSKIADAAERLERFAPYLKIVFPETQNGIIESPLRKIPKMQAKLEETTKRSIDGNLYLKMDSHLAVSGSVKARGGIYEVLKYAETLAVRAGLLDESDDYAVLAEDKFQSFFSQYTIQVGSTGNLGLSIGIMSCKLGFNVIVHMSSDAKQWKKDLLRQRGATVVEYKTDYCEAVENGRAESDLNPMSYFVDDENSEDLFLGYSVAAERLRNQLSEQEIVIDSTHPLFVYIPCGIGGAPGGVSYGLKQIFGDHVHCFFDEPVQSCCMMVGLATNLHSEVSVQDFGIDGRTEADGLAVGRPSGFVGKVMQPYLSGIATIKDENLYGLMKDLMDTEEIFIEPSACAAFASFLHSDKMDQYIAENGMADIRGSITHIAWATGGNMVPERVVDEYLQKAESLSK